MDVNFKFFYLYLDFFWGRGLYPTPHFVPDGISSSVRDSIILVLNFEVFPIYFLFFYLDVTATYVD